MDRNIILLIASLAVCIACLIGGVIAWRRKRRVLGGVLIGVALFILVAPIPTLKITVELPPTVQR